MSMNDIIKSLAMLDLPTSIVTTDGKVEVNETLTDIPSLAGIKKSTIIESNPTHNSMRSLISKISEPTDMLNESQLAELSRSTLKSYTKSAGQDVAADQRDASSARAQEIDDISHGNIKKGIEWGDEADWLSRRAEKRAGGIARATTKIAQKGLAEGASENAWNAGISDEDFIKKFGKSEFDRLTKKYGVSSIPVPDLVGYRSKEPTDPKVRSHRGLDGMGAKLKSIIKQQGVTEEGIGDTIRRGVKSVKRAAQGWGRDELPITGSANKPKDVVARTKSYDVDTAKLIRAGLDDAPEHSPAGLQKRVLDRKLKGVAEGSDKKLEFNSFADAKQYFSDLAHERGTSPLDLYGKGDAERYRQHILKHVKKKQQGLAEDYPFNPEDPRNWAKKQAYDNRMQMAAYRDANKPPKMPAMPKIVTPKLSLDTVWRKVEDVVSQIFPDGDPIDYLIPWFKKHGIRDLDVGDILKRAAKKNGYKDLYDYYDSMKDQYARDNVAEGSNSSPFDQMANLKSKSNKELDELVRFWQRALEKNPNHKIANDQLHIIKMIRAERIGKKGVAEGSDHDDDYSTASFEKWKKQKEYEKEYDKKKPANPIVPDNKDKKKGVAEGSMPYPHGKPDAGDKITWYHSNHYPKIEGTVVGWKDGHLIVKSVDPSTENTVAKYRVPINNILSVEKQDVAEDKESDPITNAVLSFYKPVVNDIHKEKLPDYVDQARELLHQTNDPKVRSKLIDIFKKGKENPYIQGGIVTTVGALLAGGILTTAQRMGLSPAQTNLALQAILNTVIPTVVSRINGKNWRDTIKYTLASAGIGTGIAAAGLIEDDEQDVMDEAAKWRRDDLEGKTWRSADWDDGDMSPGKIQIDRSGKDVDDQGDELNARPGMWGGKYKRITKKGTPTQHELGMQHNTKMRMRMQNKQGGLTGPKGKLPEEQGVSESTSNQEMINSAETMTLDQFVSVYGEENEHIWHQENKEQGVSEAFENDESNLFYIYDKAAGRLKQRMVHNKEERQARNMGYKETHDEALKAAGIIRSKFDPKKFLRKQGDKWVQVFPYGDKNS